MTNTQIAESLRNIEEKLDGVLGHRHLSYKQAAEYCGIPVPRLYQLMQKPGAPRSYKKPKQARYFLRKDLDAWMERDAVLTDAELEEQ